MPYTYRHGSFKHPSWLILYGIALHLTWAVLLFASPAAGTVSPLNASSDYLGATTLAFVYLLVAAAASWALWFGMDRGWQVVLLMPQQVALLISAGSSLEIALRGSIRGVSYPASLLLASSAPIILAAVFHTLALYNLYRRPR